MAEQIPSWNRWFVIRCVSWEAGSHERWKKGMPEKGAYQNHHKLGQQLAKGGKPGSRLSRRGLFAANTALTTKFWSLTQTRQMVGKGSADCPCPFHWAVSVTPAYEE